MILCDNIVFELQSIGGISRYWSKTIDCLDRSNKNITFLEGPQVYQNRFRCELNLKNPIIDEHTPLLLRRFIKPTYQAQVFHSSYYRISKKANANVVTIHDFINEMFPSNWRDPVLARLKKMACYHAKAIVVVSEHTRQDLLRHYPFIDPGRVHVTYNGVDSAYYPEQLDAPFQAGGATLTPRGYFLYVGTRGYCKNFPYVLQIIAEAYRQGLKLPLVIVGGGILTPLEKHQISQLDIPDLKITHLFGLQDSILRRLYSNCLALLIPSLYEGFGLPAAEAARCGALVLASRGSALEEITGDTDYGLNLKYPEEPARVLALGFDNNRAEKERMRLRSHSAKFDWNTSTTKLLEIYNELLY